MSELNPFLPSNRFASSDEFQNVLKENGCYVFGCGYVSNLFCEALDQRKLASSIKGFIVSSPTPGMRFRNSEVRAFDDRAIDRSSLVCVAVHEANALAICDMLAEAGYRNIVWIYPYLHGLLFGDPLVSDAYVSVSRILERQDANHYWLTVRYAAASAIADKLELDLNAVSDLYLKCQQLHCDESTAYRRLEQLRHLVSSMSENGYDPERPIIIDTDFRIIDGLHRLVVARLLGIERIPCNIVVSNAHYGELFSDKNKITEEYLLALHLNETQLAVLEEAHRNLVGNNRPPLPAISVIVPAYNVADYLDTCLDSVVAQTFNDIELLLIDDGSTDATANRCERWEQADKRVLFVSKPNSGVSPTRNLGIELARGEYLAFVDPDDWLDKRYLEKLYNAAKRENALFVECDLWRFDNRTGKKILRHCGQRMGVPYSLEEHMKYAPTASYKAISKRSLWIDNNVRFPSCSFESPAIYALVVALAGERCAYVAEPLYYYRRFRENSLVETAYAKTPGVADNTLGVEAMGHLVEQFKKHGLYDRYQNIMPGLVVYRLNDILAMQYHRRSADDFSALVENQRAFVRKAFPTLPSGAYLTWGGYNLNKILQHLPMLNDPSCRFNFSSIVSLGTESCTNHGMQVSHKNSYRQRMVQREFDRWYWSVLASKQPQFVFMDFIEERFDLITCDDRYITASDAYQGACVSGVHERARIAFGTQEHEMLWRQAFETLVSRTNLISPSTRIIVIENYLSEYVGSIDKKYLFENVETIRENNRVLAQYYDYVRKRHPSICIIPAFTCDCYFTDKDYEYGAVPEHLNDIVNQRIAAMIETKVLEG